MLQVYINSVLVPSVKADGTNEAIAEQEIVDVFKHSVLVRGQVDIPSPRPFLQASSVCYRHRKIELCLSSYATTLVIVPRGAACVFTGSAHKHASTSIIVPRGVACMFTGAAHQHASTSVIVPRSVACVFTGAAHQHAATSVIVPRGAA